MMQILQDDHLENLRCTKCRKYLSVFPVKNHPTRAVTCGRCSSYNDDDEGVRSFLYELIAEKHLFKCINRFEGCRKLLRVEETEAHEKVCKGKRYECLKCEDGTERHVLDLIWHYKLRHPSSYLKKSCFQGKVPVKDVMLYIQDEVVFFIFFEFDSNTNILYFGVATLIEVDVTLVFTISQGSFCKLTEKKSCKSINTLYRNDFNVPLNPVESIEIIFNFEISKISKLYEVSVSKVENTTTMVLKNSLSTAQFKTELKNYSEYKWSDNGTALVNVAGQEIDIACSNCKLIIGLPVFRCAKSRHQLCYSCRTWCGICDSSVVKSISNDILLEIAVNLSLSCKWKCGKFFDTSDLRAHEGVCELRIKKCPRCSSELDLKLMKGHLFDKHDKRHFLEEYEVEEVMNLIYNNEKGTVTFLLNDRWCGLIWRLKDNQQYNLFFGLYEKVPNVKLGVIPHNLNIVPTIWTPVNLQDIPLCKSYLTFSHNSHN